MNKYTWKEWSKLIWFELIRNLYWKQTNRIIMKHTFWEEVEFRISFRHACDVSATSRACIKNYYKTNTREMNILIGSCNRVCTVLLKTYDRNNCFFLVVLKISPCDLMSYTASLFLLSHLIKRSYFLSSLSKVSSWTEHRTELLVHVLIIFPPTQWYIYLMSYILIKGSVLKKKVVCKIQIKNSMVGDSLY